MNFWYWRDNQIYMAVNSDPHVHRFVVCANVFVRKDGKYLLLRRASAKKIAPNIVHPIGGKVDPGENPYTAAKREVLEEAGITVKNMRLEAVIREGHPIPGPGKEEGWLVFYFSADYNSGEIRDTEEGDLLLFDADEISKHILFPSVRLVLRHILNPKDGTVFLTASYDEDGVLRQDSIILDVCSV